DEGREITGRSTLITALEEARTGRLSDIVATIQGEQDEIIRAELPGVLVVQGGPGTGKTVVALHRAAYLLYTHRFPLEGQGLLVVGPNRLFLGYIELVLPSLGEAGVELAVLPDLLHDSVSVRGNDHPVTGRVKGDLRMARMLNRALSESIEDVVWTADDVPLLDEARSLLGPRPRRKGRPADDDELRTYGHIIVDEAQDLSPMQLRMLNRRSLSGSMTVVGDIAQATGHWAPSSWQDVLAHLPTRRESRVTELTVNYRTPLEIMNLAAGVLAAAAPGLRPPDSVRATGDEPVIVAAGTNGSGPAAAAVRAVEAELGAGGVGTIPVIVPASLP